MNSTNNSTTFTIPYYQFLTSDGQLQSEVPVEAKLAPNKVIELYRMMNLVRAFDKKAINLQRTGKMGTYASILGQEAVSCTIGSTLKADDIFIPYYRDYATQLMRGVKMEEIYLYWGGDERGNHYINNSKDLPISVPIGSQCLHAAGIAYALKYKNEAKVALVTCGDGATSQGDFYEALNVSGVWELPIVFVINNNRWAISIPVSKQTKAQTLAQKSIAAGIEGIQVDGNDLFALHFVLNKAIEGARQGKGACVIEALTYRLCDHTTADDASRYRNESELTDAWSFEPIIRTRKYLEREKLWDETKQLQLEEEISQQITHATHNYLNYDPPSMVEAFNYMYKELPLSLIEQREAAIKDISK